MMSGHNPNSVFFNKKNKDWTSRTLANPATPTSDNISFLNSPLRVKTTRLCNSRDEFMVIKESSFESIIEFAHILLIS